MLARSHVIIILQSTILHKIHCYHCCFVLHLLPFRQTCSDSILISFEHFLAVIPSGKAQPLHVQECVYFFSYRNVSVPVQDTGLPISCGCFLASQFIGEWFQTSLGLCIGNQLISSIWNSECFPLHHAKSLHVKSAFLHSLSLVKRNSQELTLHIRQLAI